MNYFVAVVAVAIAVVLFIFTIWGGFVWLAVLGIALAVVFGKRAASRELSRVPVEPTRRTRTSGAGPGTANERVGQD